MRKWILEDAEAVVAEYEAGASMSTLARRLGTSDQTLRRRLVEAGVTPRSGDKAVSAVPLEELLRLYESGLPASDLAKLSGLAIQTVQRRLRNAGARIRGPGEKNALIRQRISAGQAARKKIDEPRLRELHAEGKSCQEMADEFGCRDETVRRKMIRLGLPRLAAKARPERNHFWRGGYAVDESGYILKHQPDHPQATEGGYVRLHRLVMEAQAGRLLLPGEVVDHRNGDTSDNDPANLRLFPSNAEHLRATLTGVRKLPAAERERLRQEAVRRAYQRVEAILAA